MPFWILLWKLTSFERLYIVTSHPINASTKAAWRQSFANLSPQVSTRIISIGLALILILLAISAIWGAVTTRNAAARATQASEISDLYQQRPTTSKRYKR